MVIENYKVIEGLINEYDIKACNVNVLYQKMIFNAREREQILKMTKQERVVKIGCMIRDNKDLYEILTSGVEGYVDMFTQANRLVDDDIIMTVKDAIWTLDKVPDKLIFDDTIEFVKKQEFTIMYNYSKSVQFFYNQLSGEFKVRGSNTPIDHPMMVFIKHVLHNASFKTNQYQYIHMQRIDYYQNKFDGVSNVTDMLSNKPSSDNEKRDNNILIMNDIIKTFIGYKGGSVC